MLFIFLLTFFCVNIAFRAKRAQINPFPWVLATIAAVLAGIFVAALVISIAWMQKLGPVSQDELMQKVKSGEVTLSTWNELFFLVCMFGGYLLVRYRVDKKAGKDKGNLPPE